MNNNTNWLSQLSTKYTEMSWLTGSIQATPEATVDSDNKSTYGEQIFPDLEKSLLNEFNRTSVGLICLKQVIEDDYEGFTACQKNDKMTPESFNELRNYTTSVLSTEDDIRAMIIYTIINDLGKIESFIEKGKELGILDVDHDKVLLKVLEISPELSPSFNSLSDEYKTIILNGLRAEFNIGQFVQGENVPLSLKGLNGLDKRSLDFYLIHAFYDIAGAAGQFVQNGSVVMSESTYKSFMWAMESLTETDNVDLAYNSYLSKRCDKYDVSNKVDRATLRLGCMLRLSKFYQYDELYTVLKSLQDGNTINAYNILIQELNKGSDEWSTLIYYAPALLGNLVKDTENYFEAIKNGLLTLAAIYQDAMIISYERENSGVLTVMADKVAEAAAKNELENKYFEFLPYGDDYVISVKDIPQVSSSKFKSISVDDIPGNNIVLVAMGGGSDVIQASIFANLLKSTKNCKGIISVRNKMTSSQGPDGKIRVIREVQSDGYVDSDNNIYEMTVTSGGNGRFLETVPYTYSNNFPIYLVLEDNKNLNEQIKKVIERLGDVDTIIGVDTGGDGLYPISKEQLSNIDTTPDQDLRVIKALQRINKQNENLMVLTCEIAVGVDSPKNVETILLNANANYIQLSDSNVSYVHRLYNCLGFDGTNPDIYGKTPYAWQSALNGELGITFVPLPERVVFDPRNPWRSYVKLQETSKGLFLMNVEEHINSITG